MATYTPENNPYIPGDPSCYDLKWMVQEVKKAQDVITNANQAVTDAAAQAEAASDSAYNAATYANNALISSQNAEASAEAAAGSATDAAGSASALSAVLPAVDAQAAQIAALEGRMDTFSQLTQGSTTGDAELQDIRTAANGTVYATAGDAVRGQIVEAEKPNTHRAEGNIISVTNLADRKISIATAGTAFAVNKDHQPVYQVARSVVNGIQFISNAGKGVRILGRPTASNAVNRFLSDGAFTGSASSRKVAFTLTSTSVTLTAVAIIRSIPSGKNFTVYLTDANNANLVSVTLNSSAIKHVTYTGEIGEKLYCKLQTSSPVVGSLYDADIFLTLSDGTDTQIVTLTAGVNEVFTNSLLVSTENMSASFLRGSDPDLIENEVSLTAYNVGKFAHGVSSEPVGTPEMYSQFIQTFNETSTDIFMFSEWDYYFNDAESQETTDIFGRLRKYWGGRASAQNENMYVMQRAASKYPIANSSYVPFRAGAEGGRYFLDSVAECVSGANLHFISTHLDFHDPAVRRAQITEIINYLSDNNIQYAIIAGDMNYGTDSTNPPATEADMLTIADADIATWTAAGLLSAQKGQFAADNGFDYINTSNNTGSTLYLKPYDDIIITPTLKLLNTKTATHGESDHKAIYADISLI